MNKKLFTLLLGIAMLLPITMSAKPKKPEPISFNYELQSPPDQYKSASNGYRIIKVWSFGRKEAITNAVNVRNAVHGIIFKGLEASKLKPMDPNGYDYHRDYYDAFFANESNYMQFVEQTDRGFQEAGDVMKWGKEYKIGMLVKINVDGLRKKLERDGIIETINDIFSY